MSKQPLYVTCLSNYVFLSNRTPPLQVDMLFVKQKYTHGRRLVALGQISDNQDSLDMDPQEHSFTRTIDEEAELEERADREREEGHQEQDDEEDDREHEVMTAGSKYMCLDLYVYMLSVFQFFFFKSFLLPFIPISAS